MYDPLSIIIPTLNEEDYLPQLLESLLHQDYTGKTQIIIVDGKSADNTLQKATSFKEKFSDLTIVISKPGVSYQRNIGVIHAKYQTLLFIDSDMILGKGTLTSIMSKIKTKGCYVHCCTILPQRFNPVDYLLIILGYPVVLFLNLLGPITLGGFLLTSKENHQHINGFNEDLYTLEDMDYGIRSKAQGAKHYFHIFPFVFASVRRVEKMGRLKYLRAMIQSYMSMRKHGIEYVQLANYSRIEAKN